MVLNPEELEFPAVQRGLVDICFEEAQYESGIDVLISLCSPRYRPSPLHIRQLVYMSLYPPPLSPQAPSFNANDFPDVMSSPQKFRPLKDDSWPKPSSRQKALALLRSYVNVNSPSSLMRAFPFYSYVNEDGIHDVNPFIDKNLLQRFHEDNTPIRNEVKKFQSLKDCWECLKDGFVKGKQQGHISRTRRQFASTDDDITEESTILVGSYAWPILEWFISIFEKDQELERRRGGVTISPLLLVQIPPPKIKQGPRTELDVLVEIFRECFVLPLNSLDALDPGVDSSYLIPEKRRELGMRLLSLLVNLSQTNPPLLPSSQLTKRLSMMLRDFEFDPLSSFLSSLRSSHAIFKLDLLRNVMTKNDERSKAPTAKARAKPRTKNIDREHVDIDIKVPEPMREAFVVPSLERVTSSLFYLPAHDHEIVKIGLMKYHLVSALFETRNNSSMEAFDEAIRSGSLNKTVEEGFGRSQAVEKFKKLTLNIVEAWGNQL